MSGAMNILDSDMNVIAVGFGLDFLSKGMRRLQLQTYFQVYLAKDTTVPNDRDPLFGPITTGGEVYGAGISISLQL